MSTDKVRDAVAMYLNESLTEAEAARRAGLSRAQLRAYARTCGLAVAASEVDYNEDVSSSDVASNDDVDSTMSDGGDDSDATTGEASHARD